MDGSTVIAEPTRRASEDRRQAPDLPLTDHPLPDILAWVKPYITQWNMSFDLLAVALDEENNDDGRTTTTAR